MLEETVVLRNYAHIGDSVWELFVRTYTIYKTSNAKLLHKITLLRNLMSIFYHIFPCFASPNCKFLI